MNFSEIIKKRMSEQKIKPSELASATGYSQQYIKDLLEGHRRWNEATLTKVCSALSLVIELKPLKATGTEGK